MITGMYDMASTGCFCTNGKIRQLGYARWLLVFIILLSVAQSVNGAIPKDCYDRYIETGARPLGPEAPPIDVLTRCKIVAATAREGLGGHICTANSGMVYIDEYCETPCTEDKTVEECFCILGQDPNQFAYPGNEPPCTFPPEDEPDEEKELGQNCDGEGNPCSPASGNKYQRELDYRSANGRLVIARYYNSLAPSDGIFGFGWSSSLTRKLEFDPTSPDLVTIRQASGRGETWVNRDGVWMGDADTLLRFEADTGGYKVTDQRGTVAYFDTSGRLVREQSQENLSTGYVYDADQNLTRVNGPFGREINIAYNTSGHIVSITTPDGELQYGYDEAGNLTSVTYPDGNGKTYHYEDTVFPHHLTGITDENSDRYATWSYDDSGRVISSEHAGEAEKVVLTYNGDGSTTVNDSLGAERTYSFVTLHGVRKVESIQGDRCTSCSNGDMRERTYDDNGRLTGYTDWRGSRTSLSYNDRGLVQTRTEANGEQQERTTAIEWHAAFNLPTRITQSGSTTNLTYNSTGQLLIKTTIDNGTNELRTHTYSYIPPGEDGAGLLAAVDGPLQGNSDITSFHYDSLGNITAITNALGQTIRITRHDPSGRPLRIEDPNGLINSLSYDARGRLIQQNVSDGSTTRTTNFVYDAVGNLIRSSAADGVATSYIYDAAQRLIGMEDQQGNRIDYTLDPMGNRLTERVSDPQGALMHIQQQVYDQLSQLHQQLDSRQYMTEYSYDANGNLNQILDTNTHTTIHNHDALDRLIQTTDALNGLTQYSYDAEDRLTAVTDPLGRSTHYEYDGLGNLIRLTSPDTGITTYTYNEAGSRLSQTDARNVTTAYEYDLLSRLTAVHYPDSALDVSFTYDQGENGIGKLTSMSDAEGTTDYAYNPFGDLIRQSRTSRDGTTTQFEYAYDTQGRLASQTYPSGHRLLFSYDQGRLDALTLETPDGAQQPLVTNLHYLPFGPAQSFDYGNGLSLVRSFDQDYRLSGQRIAGLLESSYAYDRMDNIIDWADLLDTGRDQHFSYDLLNRLTRATRGNGSGIGYTYDALGNRLSTASWSAYSYMSATVTLPRYDAVGNAIQDSNGRYRYDDSNRMVGFSANSAEASYGYNARGERVRKTLNGVITRFRYGPGGELLGEYDEAGQAIREYFYLHGQPVALLNAQGAPVQLLQTVRVNHNPQRVELGEQASTPVIIAGPLSYNGGQGAVVALSHLDATRVSVSAREWDYLDGAHAWEDVSLLALPPGRYPQADGSVWEVGRFTLSGTKQWHDIAFGEAFEATPRLFLTQQTSNDANATSIRARNLDAGGFQAYLQEQESLNDGHGEETIGYLAIHSPNQGGTATLHGASFDYQLSQLSLNSAWTTQGDQQLRLQEEASSDSELGHTAETLDILRIEGHLFAQAVTTNGGDTISIRRRGPSAEAVITSRPAEVNLVYLHTDHLGAVVKATDEDQAIVWDAVRKPFGRRNVTVEQVEMPLGFPGQYYDQETNNYYNYFRDYDPATGRYLQSDPIGLNGGLNTYLYAKANAIRFVDASGLDYIDVNNILNDINNRFPNLPAPDTVKYKPLDSNDPYNGASGQYDRYTGEIWLPPEQQCKQLSMDEFIALYQTLHHETRHANQGPFEYRYDFIYERITGRTGPSHSRIIRDTGEIVTGRPGVPGSSIVDKIEDIYRNTRNRDPNTYECGCK